MVGLRTRAVVALYWTSWEGNITARASHEYDRRGSGEAGPVVMRREAERVGDDIFVTGTARRRGYWMASARRASLKPGLSAGTRKKIRAAKKVLVERFLADREARRRRAPLRRSVL